MPIDTPRTETEIAEDGVNALIAQTRDLTDLSRSSSLSLLFFAAVAPEVAQLYAQGIVVAEGFYISSATGAALRRRLADFGIMPRPATAAYATVTLIRAVGFAGDVAIPSGYIVRARGADDALIDFTIRNDTTLAAGFDEVDTEVDAAQAGTAHNIGAGGINELEDDSIDGLGGVINKFSVTTGTDADTDETLRAAFHRWREGRRASTVESLIRAAEDWQRLDERGQLINPVLTAAVREYLDAPGPDNAAADLLVFGQNGQAVSLADRNSLQEVIDGYIDDEGDRVAGWRAAGAKVRVVPCALVATHVECTVEIAEGGSATTIDRLRAALRSKVDSLPIRSSGTNAGRLTRKMLFDVACEFGDELSNFNVIQPAVDVIPPVGEKLTVAGIYGGSFVVNA